MSDSTAASIEDPSAQPPHAGHTLGAYTQGRRVAAVLSALLLVTTVARIDRIVPFILAESIKADLALGDTQIGLPIGLAFAMRQSVPTATLLTGLAMLVANQRIAAAPQPR